MRLEDMNSLFGDATTMAPTPQTLAEAESLFGSANSPNLSFRLNNDENQDVSIPNVDLEPPEPSDKDQERSEGLGGWISNLVKKGAGHEASNAGGSGKYRRVAGNED